MRVEETCPITDAIPPTPTGIVFIDGMLWGCLTGFLKGDRDDGSTSLVIIQMVNSIK